MWPAWECGWPIKGHTIKEYWLLLFHKLSNTNIFSVVRNLCSPALLVLWLCLSWACSDCIHSSTITKTSCVQLSWCVQRNTASLRIFVQSSMKTWEWGWYDKYILFRAKHSTAKTELFNICKSFHLLLRKEFEKV